MKAPADEPPDEPPLIWPQAEAAIPPGPPPSGGEFERSEIVAIREDIDGVKEGRAGT
jgi:hypothetical protein